MFTLQALLLVLEVSLSVAETSCNSGYYLNESSECIQCSVTYGLCYECDDEGTDIVVNGSFEEPDVPYGTSLYYDEITGWKASETKLEIEDWWEPSEGEQYLETSSIADSYVYQEVQTAVNQRYLVRFDYSPYPGQTASQNQVGVNWAGERLGVVAKDGELMGTSWAEHEYTAIGNGDLIELAFEAIDSAQLHGGFVDNIRLVRTGCTQCINTAFLNADGDCQLCSDVINYCRTCENDATGTLICTSCQINYYLEENECLPISVYLKS